MTMKDTIKISGVAVSQTSSSFRRFSVVRCEMEGNLGGWETIAMDFRDSEEMFNAVTLSFSFPYFQVTKEFPSTVYLP